MKITRLVIGTTNPGKLAEWKSFLQDQVEILGLSDFPKMADISETGSTFAENARIKASTYAKALNEFVYSEDGGMEIDALNGWPGVSSHRLLPDGSEASDDQVMSHTLERMKDIPASNRQARLAFSAAIADPSGQIIFESQGALEGVITDSIGPVVIPGYPFRSIFFLPQVNKTYAELSDKEHDQYNHKKPVAQKVIEFLLQNK